MKGCEFNCKIKGEKAINDLKFIVDQNVGKLTKWLRLMGYDSRFFNSGDDSRMVAKALAEGRVILTRDTAIMKRRVVASGQLKAILISSDEPEQQMRQLMATLNLKNRFRPFTLCLECNHPLVEKNKEEIKDRVPPYVYQTQDQYMECPACHRVYWRGTHWVSMTQRLRKFMDSVAEVKG